MSSGDAARDRDGGARARELFRDRLAALVEPPRQRGDLPQTLDRERQPAPQFGVDRGLEVEVDGQVHERARRPDEEAVLAQRPRWTSSRRVSVASRSVRQTFRPSTTPSDSARVSGACVTATSTWSGSATASRCRASIGRRTAVSRLSPKPAKYVATRSRAAAMLRVGPVGSGDRRSVASASRSKGEHWFVDLYPRRSGIGDGPEQLGVDLAQRRQ